MRHSFAAVIFFFLACAVSLAQRSEDILFHKHMLDPGANETAMVADISGDGRLDIVSGENWYEAPQWVKHPFRKLGYNNNYIDAFSDLPLDVNGDGQTDVVTATWFARKLSWYQNPGRGRGEWKEHIFEKEMNTEFAFLVDLDNDGKARELLPQFGGKNAVVAWYEVKGGQFVRHVVDPQGKGHGIGAGDVNGDGRADILTPKGWLEAPADPRVVPWKFHPDWNIEKHTGFLHVIDVDGDGRNDVIVPYAHDYGLFWMQQAAAGKWTMNRIDDTWSQVHATTLVDLNGDGKLDLVTGKRFMAHDHDPGARDVLGVYWYEFIRPPALPKLQWAKHIIDYSTQTGAGMQLPVVDIDGDGDLDMVAPGKSGLFLFESRKRR